MKRDELEHVLRAAGAITGVTTWVIVGSQAILGALPSAPKELLVSQEVDLYAPADEAASDLVDGSIGEKSPFHESFGYYAHGVGEETAILRAGVSGPSPFRRRLRAASLESARTRPILLSVSSRHGARKIRSLFARSFTARSLASTRSVPGWTKSTKRSRPESVNVFVVWSDREPPSR
jgi:hypothetical protein